MARCQSSLREPRAGECGERRVIGCVAEDASNLAGIARANMGFGGRYSLFFAARRFKGHA